MGKKFYILLSLFLLLGFTSFAQFQQVAQLSDYPLIAHNSEDQFGTSVAADGDYVVVGSPFHEHIGAAYVFFYDGSVYDTLAVLTPSNGDVGDEFGASVAIDGDVIVIGAKNNDAAGTNAGAAYVFVKPPSGWIDMNETIILPTVDVNTTDVFGSSVDISGDIIVVGAPFYGSTYQGAVFVYEKPLSGWTDVSAPIAKIQDLGSNFGGRFGISVNISDDVLVVGGTFDDYSGTREGAAWVFVKPGSEWIDMTVPTAKLTADDTGTRDLFGASVGISGDVVVVGAPEHDVQATNAGAIYIFEKPSAGWSDMAAQTQKFLISGGSAYDYFGCSVSISNDVIVAGASGSGRVYVFTKTSTWAQTSTLFASDSFSGDQFGKSVSINGTRVVAGAVYDNDYGTNSGSAYVFDNLTGDWDEATQSAKLLPRKYSNTNYLQAGKSVAIFENIAVVGMDNELGNSVEVLEFNGSSWSKIAYLTPSDGVAGDKFGFAVDIYQDMIVVGAYEHATTGAAYVFVKPSTGWEDMTENIKLTATDAAGGDLFGYAVCVGPGYDGSAYRVVVGADKNDGNKGAAYVFEKTGLQYYSLSQTGKLTSSVGIAEHLGSSVDIEGNVLVVGANHGFNSSSSLTTGAAYVFESTSNFWGNHTEKAILLASDGALYDEFGTSVSISDDVIVVGASANDEHGTSAGAAYVYVKPEQGGWASTAVEDAKLYGTTIVDYNLFGNSVSISNNRIVVGAYQSNGNARGTAFVFEKPLSGWASGTESALLTASDASDYDYFGCSVAAFKNYLVVGALGNDINNSTDAGSAYLFQAPLTWTGGTDTDWHNVANWDFGVLPKNYDDIIIADVANDPIITASADAYNLELEASATLTISSDASTSGSLIIAGAYSGAADVTYNRYLTGNQTHFIGSPFSNETLASFITIAGLINDGTNYNMTHYVESTDNWYGKYIASVSGDFVPGQGYAIKTISDGNIYFEGTPNTAAVNATITSDANGWNLLSNPYTSAIAVTDDATSVDEYLLQASNLAVLEPSYAAVYVWDENVSDPTNLDNYKVINNAASGNLVQDYLQVGQGFLLDQ